MALDKLPDIVIDFAHDRKDEVVQILFEKYGGEHCAVVGGILDVPGAKRICRCGEGARVIRISGAPLRHLAMTHPDINTPTAK